jgi:hypothetical protein
VRMVAPCSHFDKCILVCGSATGTGLQLNSDSRTKDVKLSYEAMEWSIGGLILCAGKVLDEEEGFAHLWGPSNQVFSPHKRGPCI